MNTKISEVEHKIPDASGLVNTTVFNAKIGEIENKMPNVSLVKKTAYITKISDIEKKYCITSDYNKFTKDIFDAKVKEKKWVD